MKKRIFKSFKCGECGEKFKPDSSGLWYIENEQTTRVTAMARTVKVDDPVRFVCPHCISKWEDSWKTKSMECLGANAVECKFTNGKIQTIAFQDIAGKITISNIDVPQFFLDDIKTAFDKWRKERVSQEICEFKLVDEFEDQHIYLKVNNGFEATIRFRYGKTGQFVFDKTFDNLPVYVLQQFNVKLQEAVSRG